MTTINPVGNGLSGTTGTGSFAGSTSPTFVTPVLGTPTSGTLTNCTGLPASTGISGLGTGVATALGQNVTGSGGIALATSPTFVTPALGTPASGTLTNCTGLPASTGISGLGTGVATALGQNVTGSGGIALATSPTFTTPVLGTPTSGTLTNCTGLPVSTGISGLGANVATWLATPTSANLATAVATTSTGSGSLVFGTSPTLVTPTLGAASATSINFGGSSLANYVASTSWTPVFTFATPGNLSVVYTTQSGVYVRIGSIVWYQFLLNCTPTFTTASGALNITGLPVTAGSLNNAPGPVLNGTGITYPAGTTVLTNIVTASTAIITLNGSGTAANNTTITTTNFTTTVGVLIFGSGFYFL